MRGYFGIGVEGLSKPMNAGNLFRSAHAFGASFVFTVAASSPFGEGDKSDTSKAASQVPFYNFDSVASVRLPDSCRLVGIEFLAMRWICRAFAIPAAPPTCLARSAAR